MKPLILHLIPCNPACLASLATGVFLSLTFTQSKATAQTSQNFPNGISFGPATSPDSYMYSNLHGGTRAATILESFQGGTVLYSPYPETQRGNWDGGIHMKGMPLTMVLGVNQSPTPLNGTLEVWRYTDYGNNASSIKPIFKIDSALNTADFNGLNVKVEAGSLSVAGSPVLTAANASTQLDTQGYIRSTGGAVNLPLATNTWSIGGSPLFTIDAGGNLLYPSNRSLKINSTTISTNSTTGALTIAGGLGVGMDSYINGIRFGTGNGNIADNLAIGKLSLQNNTTGQRNVGVGQHTLFYNTTGYDNAAFGAFSMTNTTSGNANTAGGVLSLYSNTSGWGNTAFGSSALQSNTTGGSNVAMGLHSLYSNTIGQQNLAIGLESMRSNTVGNENVAIGVRAARYQENGTALTDPERSIYIGTNSKGKDNNDDNSIVIGYGAVGEGAHSTVVGNPNTQKSRLFGQVTLTNTPWKNRAVSISPLADPSPTTTDNEGNALVVEGHTVLKGKVVIEQAQGDISMGIYGQ